MGVLEDAQAKRDANRVRPQDTRILMIEDEISCILGFPIYIYFDNNICISKNGFYNNIKQHINDIYLPKNAADLGDDEFFALLLTESMYAFCILTDKRAIIATISVSAIVILSFITFFLEHLTWIMTIIITVILISSFFYRKISIKIIGSKLYSGNYHRGYKKKITPTMDGAYEADNLTIGQTGNVQALINALNFIKFNESDITKIEAVDKRIDRLAAKQRRQLGS
ncbi:MAG: hypothetical protein LBO62_08185 [Endomicrobium sp.]|jgi:hypothetical protein|nr:hypothetical protein [Endomicrobium sp.]